MVCIFGRCNGINQLDNTPCRRLNKFINFNIVPVDREVHENERLISAVVQAKRVRIALAYPFRYERLKDESPDKALDMAN